MDVVRPASAILPVVLLSLAYAIVRLLLEILVIHYQSDARLRAEVLALRHQLRVLERQVARPRTCYRRAVCTPFGRIA